MPNFEIVIEKAPKKPDAAAGGKKEENKKDAKKAEKPKQEKKKEAPKKEAAKKETAPVEKKPAGIVETGKWTAPQFYDLKTEIVNSKDLKGTLSSLFSAERWDDKAISFWLLQYEKYNAKEGAEVHICNNLLGGFIQRIDEKLRPHSIGTFGVYGQPGELEQFAVMLYRGAEIPPQMLDHPQFEYWKKTKLDVSKAENQELILNYLTTKEDGVVQNRTVQSW